MTTVAQRATRPDRAVLLGRLGLAIAAIAVVKFVAILASVHWDLALSPWGFLALFAVPFLIARAVLPRHPRTGAVVAGIPATLLAGAAAVAVAAGIEPFFVDYLAVFIGGPLAMAAAVLSVLVCRQR
jgi:hypothetical protein